MESIYNLLPSTENGRRDRSDGSPFTGQYEKHLNDASAPSYSTFFQRGHKYDGSNVRFFKQRSAVIGKQVGDTVDPNDFLRVGGGTRHVVHAQKHEKIYTKPPLNIENDLFNSRQQRGSSGGCEGAEGGIVLPSICGSDGGVDASCSARGGEGMGGSGGGSGHGNSCGLNNGLSSSYPGCTIERKNFILSNIADADTMVPKRRKEQPTLMTQSKSFGKVPDYLSRVKKQVSTEKEQLEAFREAPERRMSAAKARLMYRLRDEERLALVDKLRKAADERVRQLRSMPLSKDTIAQRRRREVLEAEVSEIEVAIEKMTRTIVVVYKNDPVYGQAIRNEAVNEAKRAAMEISRVH